MRTLVLLVCLLLAVAGAWAQEPGGLAAVGQQIFADNCAQCHRSNGEGLPGSFPALNKNPFVTGDPTAVIATVLNGRKGPLGQMPAWKDQLSDQQIAAVATYIRQAWTNRAAGVTPAMAAEVRKSKK